LETLCTDLEVEKYRFDEILGWSVLEKANALATARPFSLLEGEAR
jgi:hypothetical protein